GLMFSFVVVGGACALAHVVSSENKSGAETQRKEVWTQPVAYVVTTDLKGDYQAQLTWEGVAFSIRLLRVMKR
ncbi:MAG: hypothetical protein WAM60_08660, partial [Candidatus Promineifilaceae bacterium]